MRFRLTPPLRLLGMAAVLLATSAAPEPVQSYDSYGSWLVVCDNGLSCVAKGFADTDQGAQIVIERSGGPNGALLATISVSRKISSADIRVDGRPVALTGWTVSADDDLTTVSSQDLGAVRALVQRLHNATRLTFGGEEAVPLDGFAAAMLRLDARQGRVGGVTALLRTGAAAAAGVPPAPRLPHIPNHPIAAKLGSGEDKRLIAAVRSGQKAVFAKEDCETDLPTAPEAYALDGKQALVIIPCIMGAYQGSSLAFIAPRGDGPARRLVLPTPYLGNDTDRDSTGYLTESDFDPATGTLSMAAKGRGLADCGMSASWIWDGAAFRLAEMALQQSCGGVEPGDWPTLFRSTH
jgi:hypothetical protein